MSLPSERPGWLPKLKPNAKGTVYFPIRSATLLTDHAALRGSIHLLGRGIAVATTHRHGCRRPLRHASLDDQPVCATVEAQARALHRGNKDGDNIHIARTSRTPHTLCSKSKNVLACTSAGLRYGRRCELEPGKWYQGVRLSVTVRGCRARNRSCSARSGKGRT